MTSLPDSIYVRFRKQASIDPKRPALVCREQCLDYGELLQQVNRISSVLRENGVKPGSVVVILLGRSVALVAAILAVNKCGAVYVPVDPAYPYERIRYMTQDSGASLLLCDDNRVDLASRLNVDFVSLDKPLPAAADEEDVPAIANNLAYITYTSGTTGKPKGVIIKQNGVLNVFDDIADRIEFIPFRRILCLSTVSFDIFAIEALLPLTRGMLTVLADEYQMSHPREISRLIRHHLIDMLQITPSRLELLLNDPQSALSLANVLDVMIGGERVSHGLIGRIRRMTHARLYNMYGPTEATIWCAYKNMMEEEEITVGTPIRNMRMFVMDGDLRPLAAGQEGELCIAGIGLAHGYANRKELTSGKFVQSPYVDGELVYRTGDLAVMDDSGEFHCLGRMDEQIKWRGYRIELKEIEAVLLAYPGITQAVVWGEQTRNVLIATFTTDKVIQDSRLKQYLQRMLPEYMIPAVFCRVERIPLSHNGKVDRQTLMTEYRESGGMVD
ncbi:amino acid adenylation domain-containing protein [Paenibacillus sp. SYP-B4298]|uniref:amino acid adenylation domain-containing protein n=1 Tax=Paenibacillus sp. SYP-B4298 TaxID=2996034 RepID=UPI0022DCF49A|nr:amino acid adenylation domain-containing protein [Paenibacillus sp. SYP-B4298]